MKKIILVLLVMVSALSLHATSMSESFYKECENMKGMNTVFISKAMLNMTRSANSYSGPVNLSHISSSLDGLWIVSAEEESTAGELRTKVARFLKDQSYEVLLRVREDDDKTDILMKKLPGGKFEYVLVNDESDEVTVIILEGALSMQQMMQALGR